MERNGKKISSFSSDFFTKSRSKPTPSKITDSYSKIEEIKWNKDVMLGKTKVVGTLPSDKKMI